MLVATAFFLAQAGAIDPDLMRAFTEYNKCVHDHAIEWATTADRAEVVAKAATTACDTYEPVIRNLAYQARRREHYSRRQSAIFADGFASQLPTKTAEQVIPDILEARSKK